LVKAWLADQSCLSLRVGLLVVPDEAPEPKNSTAFPLILPSSGKAS
jgi:hypothetical protein